MKKVFLFVGLILPLFVGAQDATLLKVTGESELRVLPDQAIVSLHLEGIGRTTDDANRQSERKLKVVQQILQDLNHQATLLKVISSNVYAVRKNAENKPTGYRANLYAEVKLAAISTEVSQFIEALTQSGEEVNSNVRYNVSKALAQSKKEELIRLALDDAMAKAQVITQHMNLTVDKPATIQYGPQNSAPQFARMEMAMDAGTESVAYELKELVLNESIYVEFYLK